MTFYEVSSIFARVEVSPNFDDLLAWLDSDREQVGEKYEIIRSKLIKYFSTRGFRNSEELADETIDRVARKVNDISPSYGGDPIAYFLGVARSVITGYP